MGTMHPKRSSGRCKLFITIMIRMTFISGLLLLAVFYYWEYRNLSYGNDLIGSQHDSIVLSRIRYGMEAITKSMPLHKHQPHEDDKDHNVKEQVNTLQNQAEFGLQMLQSGDLVGAESICFHATQLPTTETTIDQTITQHNTKLLIQAWTCLGQARLALHESAWKMLTLQGNANHNHQVIFIRLFTARSSFEQAVQLDPTCLEARLGLGTCLLLLATRWHPLYLQHRDAMNWVGEGGVHPSDSRPIDRIETSSQLLFYSILHLNAVILMTSQNMDMNRNRMNEGKESSAFVSSSDETLQVTASINMALSYLALDDAMSAIPLLQQASDFVNDFTSDASEVVKGGKKSVLSLPDLNLAGAYLQEGRSMEAFSIMTESKHSNPITVPCHKEMTAVFKDGNLSATERINRVVTLQKRCSIALNNLAIAMESGGGDGKEEESDESFDNTVNADIHDHYRCATKFEKELKLSSDGFAKVNYDACLSTISDRTDNYLDEISVLASDNESSDIPLDEISVLASDNESSDIPSNDGSLVMASDTVNDELALLRIEQEILNLKLSLLSRSSKLKKRISEALLDGDDSSSSLSNESLDIDEAVSRDSEADLQGSNESEALLVVDEEESSSSNESLDIDEAVSRDSEDDLQGSNESEALLVVDEEESSSPNESLDIDEAVSGDSKVDLQGSNESEALVVDDEEESLSSNGSLDIDEAVSGDSEALLDIKQELVMPSLYAPIIVEPPKDLAPESRSYMKVADAYMEKGKFKLASKQFLKVMKKSPGYIPAILGYATSLERFTKPKFFSDVVKAYMNATQSALQQADTRLAEAAFHRATEISNTIEESKEKIEVLGMLASIAFSNKTAVDIYYKLGLEYVKDKEGEADGYMNATYAFRLCNAFAERDANIGASFHGGCTLELGKIALDHLNSAEDAVTYAAQALSTDLDGLAVDAYLVSGRSKEILLDYEGAIEDYQRAIALPKIDSSATVHYRLGLALKMMEGVVTKDVKEHIEVALNLGMDANSECINILGEDNIAVIKSINRAEWRKFHESSRSSEERGGIISGSGSYLNNESLFRSEQPNESTQSSGGETLSILEQGAASYDGKSAPVEDSQDDTVTFNSNRKASALNEASSEKFSL